MSRSRSRSGRHPSLTPASLPLAVSFGDPTGVGPQVALEALAHRDAPDAVVVGPANLVAAAARILDLPVPRVEDTGHVEEEILFSGRRDARGGAAAYAALVVATRFVQDGRARGLVTAPIDKNAWRQAAGDRIVGHTEILAGLATSPAPGAPLMLLVDEAIPLRVALLTNHLPLADVAGRITREATIEKLRLLDQELRARFGIEHPRIALLGLNPHAGEGGELGREEIDVLTHAAEAARGEGISVDGPLPGDAAFSTRTRARYDAHLAAFHDQGLAPFKALSHGSGVNVTLGLGFVRTSPDHGTAHDLAPRCATGEHAADAASMRAALFLADRLSREAVSRGA